MSSAPAGAPGRWRGWLGSIGVQGLGALATLAVGLLIAALQGPQAQGRYGLVRSSADLLLALGLLGLPQGIVHMLNHLRAAPLRVERWMWRYGLALLLGAALALAGCQAASSQAVADPTALLALAVGVLGWVVHALQRAFVLCRGGTRRFSWLTVVPALTLLAAVAVLARLGSQRYEFAVAFSGVLSACAGAWMLRPLQRESAWAQGAAPRWPLMLSPSLHALAQTSALALQPFLALQLLQHAHPAGAELGWFVFAGYVYQAFALPAGFVVPLLFARASRAAGQGARLDLQSRVRATGWFTTLGALVAAALLPWAVPRLFGPAYDGAVGACVVLALCGPALVVGRLHTALLLGEGRFATVTALFLLRAALVPLGMLAFWRWTPLSPVTGAAAGWALAEAVTSGVQALLHAAPGPAPKRQSTPP